MFLFDPRRAPGFCTLAYNQLQTGRDTIFFWNGRMTMPMTLHEHQCNALNAYLVEPQKITAEWLTRREDVSRLPQECCLVILIMIVFICRIFRFICQIIFIFTFKP